MSLFGKRKRNVKDMRRVLFTEDCKDAFNKVSNLSTANVSAVSKSWERCGDSFLETQVTKNLQSSGKRSVAALARSVRHSTKSEELSHITWSSSEDEQLDSESGSEQLLTPCSRVTPDQSRPAHQSTLNHNRRYMRMLNTSTDDLPTIDSESDVDELDDKCTSKERMEFSIPTKVVAEISDYSSDEEDGLTEESVDLNQLESTVAGDASQASIRSVSAWVRSAQTMLQTPQKSTDILSKTPEDSSKKRKKFERGGLAERLNRLQCRQRSAISFWRHQSLSDSSATPVRSGVLALRVQGVQEDGRMLLALCDRTEGGSTSGRCLVLFSKETAAHLTVATRDLIHVYPPWQTLIVEGEPHPVILNTLFSQKVVDDGPKLDITCPKAPLTVEKCLPCPLTRCFGLEDRNQTPVHKGDTYKQVYRSGCKFADGVCDSLLEAMEGLGPAGRLVRPVEVTVQRVYCPPLPLPPSQAARRLRRGLETHPPADPQQKPVSRLCALVQDVHGVFSEVRLQCVSSEEEWERAMEQLQGQGCVLQDARVVQRLTRDRSAQLFSLIDSLWPPLIPPKVHKEPSECQCSRESVPAPSFCYRLEGRLDCPTPPQLHRPASPLYRQPVQQNLRQFLQSELAGDRCSFSAAVVYKRLQRTAVAEKETLLFVTDPSLQGDESPGQCSRTVTVCLSPRCVLQSSVTQAIASSAPSPSPRLHLSFRDVVKKNGQILCVEHTVVQLPPSECLDLQVALPNPVRLDKLRPETPANSLCTLTGVLVGVDEDTAFSWPACNVCGSEQLEKQEAFLCSVCRAMVDVPVLKMQLEVFLNCPTLSHCTVRVKLQQNTIKSLLKSTGCSEGYRVESLLGKELGPLSAYVRVATPLWMGLEEINL